MKQKYKLALLLPLAGFLAGCSGPIYNSISGQRYETYYDQSASWVGETEEKLVSRWGPPKKSYTLSNGATIISYEHIWGYVSSYNVCSRKFMIENGIVTRWGVSNCQEIISRKRLVPKDKPIPEPTL